MNADLEHFKKEQFATLYAFGTPIPMALMQAGYDSPSMALGLMLLKDEKVQAIIHENRAWMREKIAVSVESLASQLDRDREYAYACENPGAAVSATMGKAKLYGLDSGAGANKGLPKRIVIEWVDEADGVDGEDSTSK